jgi:hypothetical protein
MLDKSGESSKPRLRSPSAYCDYEIIVAGHLDKHWAGWVGNLTITHDKAGSTCLTGGIPDQAALHGILVQIRNLGLTLVSLRRLVP